MPSEEFISDRDTEILIALKAAIKEIEYLHNMMHRTTASGICVIEKCNVVIVKLESE